MGSKVYKGDIVKLDGLVQRWTKLQLAKESYAQPIDSELVYLKYFKPEGVTCTADRKDRTSILNVGNFVTLAPRLFTVGRLDRDSSGLILLTSDGRVNVAMLNHTNEVEKVYEVEVNHDVTDAQIEILQSGVEITYPSLTNSHKMVKETTVPCKVKRIRRGNAMRQLEITLVQGRNRQIRRMIESLGYRVLSLHRTSFAGIGGKGLKVNEWKHLTDKEMKIVNKIIEQQNVTTTEIKKKNIVIP